jgi:hypothetical protein
VTPVAAPAPSVQQRALKLVDYVEYDGAQLLSATEANWSGLESILNSSHWLSDPDISQGLSVLFSDLSTGTSNAVTNPISLLAEGTLGLLSVDYAANAASNALTAVTANVETALGDGNYTLALTDFENGPTTVLYAFLNGYSESVGSSLISPEFGLLTNTADGAATGQIDALAQISNTIADEIANLGGANLTTDSLPLISGQLDLSVSISQILNDLGIGSDALTINGLLGTLDIDPTKDLLPALTVGDVLGYLGIPDSFGISIDSILAQLGIGSITGGVYSDPGISIDSILADLGIGSITGGVYSDPGISIDSILADLGIGSITGGVYSDPGISIDSILADLGIGSITDGVYSDPNLTPDQILADLGIGSFTGGVYNDPGLSIDQILADLGVISDTGGIFGNPTFNLETILGDLGVNPTEPIDLDSILNALNIDPTAGIGIDSILSDLGIPSGDLTFTIPPISIPVDTILSDIGIPTTGNITLPVSIDSLLHGLGVSTTLTNLLGSAGSNNLSIPISDVYSALGLSSLVSGNGDISFSVPSLSIPVSDILSDLGLGNDPTISLNTILSALLGSSNTDPTFSVSSILSELGIGSGSTVSLDSLLGYLGIDPTSSVGINSILGELGLSGTANLDINSILGDLGLSGTGNLDINSILSDLGLSGTANLDINSILGDLGLSGTGNLDINSILGDLGLSGTGNLDINSILGDLGLSGTQGLDLDQILGDLGLNTDSTIPLPSLSIDGILGTLGINPDENILTLLGIPDTLTLDPSIGLDGGAVATYVDDLAKDLLAAVGSIAPVSADLPALLGTDPAIDLISALSGLFTDLDLPVAVSGSLSVDLTSVLAELLPTLF